MRKPSDMFDRDREWAALVRFASDEQAGATLGVVSGRRRQGKSFLLESLCQEAGGFYFSAQEATDAESLASLGAALTRHLDPVAPFVLPDWATAIDVLLRIGRDRPVPVVIDEFPYLARAHPALPSIIQGAYAPRRAERTESRTRLLLCGSAMSFMGRLLSGNAPLRGRASLDLPVDTLDYRLARRFWEIEDVRLAALVHAVVGGTPAYRTEMIRYDRPRDLDDFDDWVIRAVLSPGSPMFLEARYLLAEEPDLRDGALYHSVLAAIAEGNNGRGGIAGYVGRKTNELSHPLTVLEDSGLIVREGDAFRGNRTTFRIKEPLLTFYHGIMRPFWPQLMRATATDRIWRRAERRFAGGVLGPHFERLCRDWALHFAEDRFGGWPADVTAGTVNDSANRTTHEVDVAVIGHADGAKPPLLAIGEAKWGETMGVGHLDRLRRIRALLTASDRYDTSSTRLLCFSAAGFTDDLRRLQNQGEVDLITLTDLYD
ncbi:ATPase AAA [Acrocarpospora phusangensis]|uniref:ATPase AAA n=1 Tax=Acrocarpospora phusangensis TaxID=1070424 RepID=A0A919Q9C9_9ACTN|nr:ATP-binding protein [Acrocarpospora phusangensis]GIH23886.1 ATPase AAA [Acrocarpospora phusangensis]